MMLTKTMTTLSALLVIGSASAAFASIENDPILRGTDEAVYQTHLQVSEQRAPMTATEFSGVKRSAKTINAAENAGFDRLTDSTQ